MTHAPQALSDSGGSTPLEMFSVRGDGMTTATTDKSDVTALAAVAMHPSFASSSPVLHARTSTAAASAAFFLFKVFRLDV